MTDAAHDSSWSLPLDLVKEIDRLCDEFECALQRGEQPRIEGFLARVAEVGRERLLRELLFLEISDRAIRGIATKEPELRRRFPSYEKVIECVIRDVSQAKRSDGDASTIVRRPQPGLHACDIEDDGFPARIGRYEIQRRLGRGNFGDVLLAFDTELHRQVALKVPRADRFTTLGEVQRFIEEARMAAGLAHPGIVEVYDVFRHEESVVVVLEYVDGRSLEDAMAAEEMTPHQIARLIADVADAVDFANRAGQTHRDLKPANILLTADGQPRVADFGLAIHEDLQRLRRGEIVGSPAYMAPEQVRGETHRLDGRTDEWSLGVVLYELLAKRRPFEGETRPDLFEEIEDRDPKPLRLIDSQIPRELERICLKTLEKRMSDRYPTLEDLSEELRHWLESESLPTSADLPVSTPAAAHLKSPVVIPKGLRPFDEHDADFFFELLPGPRDRNGLPEFIRFWKTRVENTCPDATFQIGAIYGPSGCGKTSIVRAGLLPRLDRDVSVIYVEATADDTEVRLLKGIRRQVPTLPSYLTLPECLAELRDGTWLAKESKLLIVIDQFEQWLHARDSSTPSQLVEALRQCDGATVQCIVMVRVDFWLAMCRFVRELEVRLVDGVNSALVDLFDLDHAVRVLAAFGRAYGRLPTDTSLHSKEHNAFLRDAADGLSDNGDVICVRLAMFAEMMKRRPWVATTLKDLGGAAGVGIKFLDETFCGHSAPPQHRLHEKAARAVLHSLLPESGADIKGSMRSRDELLQISGYARRPQDFADVMQILDRDLRLITPTDPEAVATSQVDHAPSDAPQPCYQLTHDFLVPPLRQWLARKQMETRRGRAEFTLAEWAALWTSKPENKHLPGLWEFMTLRVLTSRKNWTSSQARMMRQATRVRGFRAVLTTLLLCISAISVHQYLQTRRVQNDRRRAESLVDAVATAPPDAVPYTIENLRPLAKFAIPVLRKRVSQQDTEETQRLHAAFALAALDEADCKYIVGCIASAPRGECANIVSALSGSRDKAIVLLHDAARNAEKSKEWRSFARIAIVALYLGDTQLALRACRFRPDCIRRTVFIEVHRDWHGRLRELAALPSIRDESLTSGLCLAVGSVDSIDSATRKTLSPLLAKWCAGASDSATHSAAYWAMNRLNLPPPNLSQYVPDGVRRKWAMGTNRHILSLVDVQNDRAGSYAVLVSTTETTIAQYSRFRAVSSKVTGAKEHPVSMMTIEDAMGYCNWLSERAGIPEAEWCYVKEQGGVLRPRRSFLKLRGFRLPTIEEFAVYCCAGATTSRHFGDDASYLSRYAWYSGNTERTHEVGQLLPNGFGLFDTLGNVAEFCHKTDGAGNAVAPFTPYVAGGGFSQDRSIVRCRFVVRAVNRPFKFGGFRVIRTLRL